MSLLGAGARSILGNATYLFGTQLATTLARGVYIVILARALGPEDFGIFNYALAWYLLFIALTYLGLDAYLVQRVSTDRASAPQALRQTLVIRATAALIVAVGSSAIATLVESHRSVWLLNAIFSIALVGRAIWMWAVSAFTAFERTDFVFRCDAIFRPLEIGAALLVLAYRPQLHWLAATHALLWCAQGGLGLYTVARNLSPFPGVVPVREAIRLLSSTLPAGVYTIVISVFMQAPIVLMKQIEPDAFRLGQFVLAYQASLYFLVIPYLFSTVMLPVVSRNAARGDGKDVRLTGLLVRITVVVGAAFLVVFGPLVPALTEALFGADYSRAGELLRAALWLAIPFAAVNFILPLFLARRAYWPVGIHGALGVALMLITMAPAVGCAPEFGGLLATGVGMSAWLALMLLATRTLVPSFERMRCIGALAAALATLLTQTYLARYGAGAQIAIGLAVLVALAGAFGVVDRDELRLLLRREAAPR